MLSLCTPAAHRLGHLEKVPGMRHFSFNLHLMSLFYLCFLQTDQVFGKCQFARNYPLISAKTRWALSYLQTTYVCVSSVCIVQQIVHSCS